MLQLSRIMIAILLAVVVQYIAGDQIRVVHVSELISYDNDFSSSSGQYNNSHICCVYGNCTCNSLNHALANLTSNVLINITTDVTLSSFIIRSDLQNVSIIGHNKPTLNCKNGTGIHFKLCHNCIIQGITWNKCGSTTKAGLKFNDPSNITIQDCSIQHSLGQAVVLSEVSGNVNLNNCNFMNNSQYKNHDAALHYYSKFSAANFVFNINNCKFSHNNYAKSLIYIENRFEYGNITLHNAIFQHNKGVSVYLVNQKIYLKGKILFLNNTADNGTGIYISNHSTVVFGENSDVAFIHNFADTAGGAIFSQSHSDILFNQNSKVSFSNNTASVGGAMFSMSNSHISLTGNSTVVFNYNTADYGGAVYILRFSNIRFEGNSTTVFNNNAASKYGGGIRAYDKSNIHFKGTSTTVFSINTALSDGGAICTFNNDIYFEGNSIISFSNNSAAVGGAVFLKLNSDVHFEGNSTTVFNNNAALDYGGAIYPNEYSNIYFKEDSAVQFTYNSAWFGGAVCSKSFSNIHFKGNSTTLFNNNTASDLGGALYPNNNSNIYFEESSIVQFTYNSAGFGGAVCSRSFSNILFIGNSTTLFNNNTASYYGGAIYIYSYNNSNINFEGNSVIQFSNNSAKFGGAVYLNWFSNVCFKGNSSTVFNGNTASYHGGAIFTYNNNIVSFEGNSSAVFNNNIASSGYGGAICTYNNNNISFEGNSSTVFNNNTASCCGGAISANDNSKISFEGNSTTWFSINIARYGGAIESFYNGTVSFKGNSIVHFDNSSARFGGAIYLVWFGSISFENNSATVFNDNTGSYYGGAICTSSNSNISFKGNSNTVFNNNTGLYGGGAIFTYHRNNIYFEENSITQFNGNTANDGGAVVSYINSNVTFKGNSNTTFSNNIAFDHGAVVFAVFDSDITFDENSKITLADNIAGNGATVHCIQNSKVIAKGHSSVIFNDVPAKWCNNICSSDHDGNNAMIDSCGIVKCSYHEGFTCQMKKCNCKEFERNLDNDSSIIVSDTVVLSSIVSFTNLSEVTIIGQNNPFVYCVNGSGLTITNSSNIVMEGITWIGCGNSTKKDANQVLDDVTEINFNNGDSTHSSVQPMNPVIHIQYSINVKIQNCVFQYSEGRAVVMSELSGDVNISHCDFLNSNTYGDHGASIHYSSNSTTNSSQYLFAINDCNFSYNKFAESLVHIENSIPDKNDSITIYDSKFYHNQGISIHVVNQKVHLFGKILFSNNNATDGSGMYITNHSTVIFGENSDVEFIENNATGKGSAVFLQRHSTISFDENSKITFHNNNASDGTICSNTSSNVIFKSSCQVTFSSNSANYGMAICSFDNSSITFKGNAAVTFNNNYIASLNNNLQAGGTIFSEDNCGIFFEENSITAFSDNTANFGAAIFLHQKSSLYFRDNSRITFDNNTANNGGAVALRDYCTATIEQFSDVIFTNNVASQCGGALYFSNNSSVSFTDNSFISFTDNTAENYGGAICFNVSSDIAFEESSTAKFVDNAASFGENLYSNGSSHTDLRNGNLTINNNTARWYYGSLFTNKDNIINDIIIDANGIVRCNDHKEYYICQYNKCYCKNIKDITSNAVVIIMGNMTLSSTIPLKDITNISLIGYNSPSICCENDGGLQFRSCSNITITNITWYKFTSNDRNTSSNITSQIKFENSSDITIDHCTFQHSVGQTVVLTEMSGDVNIKHCKFVNFNHPLKEYGAAIHYAMTCTEYSQVQLIISDCYFTNNSGVESLIYFKQHNNSNQCESIIIQNSKFDNNQGICVYLSNQNLYIKGDVAFENNVADNGAGIYISNHSNVTFGKGSSVTFIQNIAIINGSAIYADNWSSVVFENDAHAMFTSNKAMKSGGTIYSYNNSGITLKDNSSARFIDSNAEFGGTLYVENSGFIETASLSKLLIHGSEATNGAAIYLMENSSMAIREYSKIKFLNNKAEADGGCIYTESNSRILFSGSSKTEFYNNGASKGGVIYSCDHSNIELDENSQVCFNHSTAERGGTLYIEQHSYIITKGISKLIICNSAGTNGGASYLTHSSNMIIAKNSTVTFVNNEAERNGGSIYSTSTSSVMFSGNSVTNVDNSRAVRGGIIYSYNNSGIVLDEKSKVWFNHSTATELGGTLYIAEYSNIKTKGISTLIICNSEAINGGASYLVHSSSMMIKENSTITFLNNYAKDNGGSIYSKSNSRITFSTNSITNIINSRAVKGGAIYSYDNSSIILDENPQVWFDHNDAELGGSLYIEKYSYIKTKGICTLIVSNSEAINGAASYLVHNSRMTITENSTITYFNNEALEDGGGIYCKFNSAIMFKGNSTITIANNIATRGGAVYSVRDSNVEFDNNSTANFNMNKATQSGGCIHIEQSTIQFRGACTVTFNNSVVFNGVGGAIFTRNNSINFISCNIITFYKNIVYNGEGGAICCTNSYARFEGTSYVKFHGNTATDGGAAHFNMNSSLIITNSTIVVFNSNLATMGGAIDFHENSNGIFEMNSKLVLKDNNALQDGGAFYLARNCYIEFKDFDNAEFDKNNAVRGGAIFLKASKSFFKNYSTIMLKNNTASQDGGAIYITDQSLIRLMEGSSVTFSHNNASDYGGAIFSEMGNSIINFGNSTNATFLNNIAGTTGSSVYMSLPRRCNSTCLAGSILGMNMNDIHRYIITSPNEVQLYNSEVQCIHVSDTKCDLYYIKNIMLGQKILLDACMYDYYDHQVDIARFILSGSNDQGYNLDSNNTLITCNHTIELVSIYGKESISFNYTVNLSLYDNRQSESKKVVTKLKVEISPCHSGFSYNKNSQKCECYNASDIVFCSGSSSTIKRGYWFGNVTGKSTTTFCPINYCNFTCCETSNGYYHLSPVRDNQCSLHRSGAACGSCTNGYTISYDSSECVKVESCTAGQTVLTVLLTVTYWIVIVMLVFGMMYYKVGIGYLYGVTYYYSIVDILLSRNMYASRGLYLTVNIMSSFSKIIPQFLGEICVTTGLSGIDQQFIHYIHPTAVIVILIIISLLARRSQRISVFISRGIIHVICLLLLLSYTSIASTSLLLMRPLTFDGIDNIYTYLSPNIEYFHDRHLAYSLVAVLFMIFIIIGPPLLLTLEPFLNHKLNFTKIKPLLDQFQGCYRDKYRCFAGYYMICRLVVISIAIANLSNASVVNYLLILTCGIIALIHLLVKPYNSGILNKLDGIILQLIIFTEALSLFDDYDSPLVVTFSFVLVILPLLIIIGVAVFLHKDDLQKCFRVRDKSRCKNELLMADYHLIVSNDKRENATTYDVDCSETSFSSYRESFFETMSDGQD